LAQGRLRLKPQNDITTQSPEGEDFTLGDILQLGQKDL
jgi:hypothetical protein